ncbi:Hypothetical predicted protein [Octopus vulgaris]|uniref:Uncharacterized protein n=1 Tax=Octopus vulgaris TaxID=6645 RepID=A0AA36FIV3_OCTVU|nr:Hypothetical predicted protein [Octopus vulgaris]
MPITTNHCPLSEAAVRSSGCDDGNGGAGGAAAVAGGGRHCGDGGGKELEALCSMSLPSNQKTADLEVRLVIYFVFDVILDLVMAAAAVAAAAAVVDFVGFVFAVVVVVVLVLVVLV